MTERTRVVFVAGGGRSGTTLLSNMLGSIPGVLSAGEVKLAFERGIVEHGSCACRRPVVECPVWAPALEEVFGAVPSAQEAASWHARIHALSRSRQVLGLLRGGEADDETAEVVDVLGRLVQAVARVAGVGTVVDSSKFPAYGALLQRSPLLDVRFVHMIRDPRAVAWSWQRHAPSGQVQGFEEEMERFSAAKVSLMWLESTLSVPALARRGLVTATSVRYEDLVADPRGELARLAGFCGLDDAVPFVTSQGVHLGDSHAVAGNPNRVRSGPLRLRLDDEWRGAMSSRHRRTVDLITSPRRSHYGY